MQRSQFKVLESNNALPKLIQLSQRHNMPFNLFFALIGGLKTNLRGKYENMKIH